MKKTNLVTTALFVASALIGSIVIGSGVFAQSITPVSCSPIQASTPVGQSLMLTASGGDGNYSWSSPGLVTTNPTGVNFTVAFNGIGTYPVTVASAGENSTCEVTVTAAVVVPGLPNTGEMPQ